MTNSELGARVKAKYPAYAQYSDEEIGAKMMAKYPQYSQAPSAQGESVDERPGENISDVASLVGGLAGSVGGPVGRMAGAGAFGGLGQQAESMMRGEEGDPLAALNFLNPLMMSMYYASRDPNAEPTEVESAQRSGAGAQAGGEALAGGLSGLLKFFNRTGRGVLDTAIKNRSANLPLTRIESVKEGSKKYLRSPANMTGEINRVLNKIYANLAPDNFEGFVEGPLMNEQRILLGQQGWKNFTPEGYASSAVSQALREAQIAADPGIKKLLNMSHVSKTLRDFVGDIPLGGKLMNRGIDITGKILGLINPEGTISRGIQGLARYLPQGLRASQ